MAAPFISLNDGNRMPAMGINTWNIHFEDVGFVIRGALKSGYMHIDTSVINYNEKEIGKTLKDLIDSGKIKRTDVYITTKLPPTANNPQYIDAAILNSLKCLQLDYIDLYLIHAPIGLVPNERIEDIKWNKDGSVCLDNTTDHIRLWKKMEDLVLKGLTKSIGLANFNSKQITKIIPHCTIIPAVLQIEYHIYLQQPALIEFCRNQHIAVISYGPLGVHDSIFSNTFSDAKRELPDLLELAEVKQIAKKYTKTPSQVLIRWILEKGMAFILKITNYSRMHEIIEASKFTLKEEDVAILNSLDRGFRYVDFKFLKGAEYHPEYPF